MNDLENIINQHIANGEIVNPRYNELKDSINSTIAKDSRVLKDQVMDLFRSSLNGPHGYNEKISDVYYGWPSSMNEVLSFKKKLEKINDLNHPYNQIYINGKVLVAKWVVVAEKMKQLKGMVVKTSAKRAEAKQVAQVAMEKKFTDSSSLIKLFESHLQEYIDGAKKRAAEFVDYKIGKLKAVGFDLNIVAPRPNGNMGRSEYIIRGESRSFYNSITARADKSNNHIKDSDPYIVDVVPSRVQAYIDQAGATAEASYREFMRKMIEKIGKPVVDAKMSGNIWTGTTLTVTTNDGEEQVWNTQMIINFSKYQKMFNQFPSRRKK